MNDQAEIITSEEIEHNDKALAAITASSTGILATIEKLATDPSVDPDKLERILAMQERIFDKNAEIQFNEAMTSCQAELPPVKKTGRNAQTNSDFAKLEVMQATAMPIVSKHGFAVSYGSAQPPSEMEIRITAKVSHVGGHSRDYQIDMPRDDVGIKGTKNKTAVHGTGSTLTYGQRYLFKMIFNIEVEGMDVDGNRPPRS